MYRHDGQLQIEAAKTWGKEGAVPVEQRRALIVQLQQERESVEGELESVTQSIAEISSVLGV